MQNDVENGRVDVPIPLFWLLEMMMKSEPKPLKYLWKFPSSYHSDIILTLKWHSFLAISNLISSETCRMFDFDEILLFLFAFGYRLHDIDSKVPCGMECPVSWSLTLWSCIIPNRTSYYRAYGIHFSHQEQISKSHASINWNQHNTYQNCLNNFPNIIASSSWFVIQLPSPLNKTIHRYFDPSFRVHRHLKIISNVLME